MRLTWAVPTFKSQVKVKPVVLFSPKSHAGKVVLRSWYEKNKHIFPASRWEPYDPEKKWDKYTVRIIFDKCLHALFRYASHERRVRKKNSGEILIFMGFFSIQNGCVRFFFVFL